MRSEDEIRKRIEKCKQDILRLVTSGIFTEDELIEYTGYLKALNYVLQEDNQ